MTLLAQKHYDILVIGGGIYGACILWEAVLRGLSAALVEQNDFASATSANSLKIIHGGLRYIQQADFRRMRISTRERTTLMRIAPHLVRPMPVIIPTYGHGLYGREALSVAMRINDWLNFDRNRAMDDEKCTPDGRILSRGECLALLPGLPSAGLTGAALYYDAQVYNSERLVLAFLMSAARRGGDLANYARVVGFIHERERVIGAKVLDQFTGRCFEVRAKMVINSTGGWVPGMMQLLPARDQYEAGAGLARAINVITRPIFDGVAVGLNSGERSNRLYFVAPWRDHSIIGTEYSLYDARPEALAVDESEVDRLLQRVNRAYPPAQLRLEDVKFIHRGLLPLSDSGRSGNTVKLRRHPHITDHRREGIEGVLSVEGVKYTTARHVASVVLDHVFKIWGYRSPDSVSATTPLSGGRLQSSRQFLEDELAANPWRLSPATLERLIYSYGSEYVKVLEYLPDDHEESGGWQVQRAVLSAQVQYAVRNEMAFKLVDFAFRRTELASVEQPDAEMLAFCAQEMGKCLTWDARRIQQEIREVDAFFAWRRS